LTLRTAAAAVAAEGARYASTDRLAYNHDVYKIWLYTNAVTVVYRRSELSFVDRSYYCHSSNMQKRSDDGK